jgi:hypothetical protein
VSRELAHRALSLARAIEDAAPDHFLPPSEVAAPKRQPVVPHSLFAGTRGYIEKIVYQVNATYEASCYDACAVMIRRLVEILIIECFDLHGMAVKIKHTHGDFLFLQDLISITLAESSWNLGRNTKAGLTKLKTIGDQSAHSRRYNARREYIDDVIIDVRTVSEELLYLSGLRK